MAALTSPFSILNTVASSALPVLGTVNQLTGALQNFGGGSAGDQLRREQELALQQLQAQQRLQQQQLESDVALERERIAINAAAAEEERRAALRRAVARQRAQFGASGIGGAGGSSEAVLLGLFEESESELAERERLDALRNSALDLDVSSRQSLNVLQRTQLQQRQRLDRELTNFGLF